MTYALALALVPACYLAARDIPAGAVLAPADVATAPCRDAGGKPPLRYDRATGSAVAAMPIVSGTYLGHVVPLVAGPVAKGETLLLRSSIGSVTIEREVVALQPSRRDRKLFVRDADGQVFAVRFEPGAPR